MKLEDALRLRRGTKLVATHSWEAPGKFTKGQTYVMQDDVRPVWRGKNFFNSTSVLKFRPNEVPCNAEVPTIDDRGDLVYPTYHGFEIAQ